MPQPDNTTLIALNNSITKKVSAFYLFSIYGNTLTISRIASPTYLPKASNTRLYSALEFGSFAIVFIQFFLNNSLEN